MFFWSVLMTDGLELSSGAGADGIGVRRLNRDVLE